MQIFDAPEREFCVIRRSNTKTPLQALVLLNDIQMTEAARKLAERMCTEGGEALPERISHAYRLVLSRRPSPRELEILQSAWQEQSNDLASDPAAANRTLAVGESPENNTISPIELAGYARIARLILNLDETVTKN
jgi:hypothetical protein